MDTEKNSKSQRSIGGNNPSVVDQDETFTVYPAIDLRHGRVVRLVQGDPARQTVYGDDPAGVANRWLQTGTSWLHVVNLDGAFGEKGRVNQAALTAILEVAAQFNPPAKVQFGGGLRSLEDIERALSAGVSRVILGTLAVEAPQFAADAVLRHSPEVIGLGIDVRHNRVYIRGWAESATIDPVSLGLRFYELGLRTCVYTDIQRDGSGRGINVAGIMRFARATGLSVIASGGASSLEDVHQVRQANLAGVIIGRALYDGMIDLKEALRCQDLQSAKEK